MNYYAYIADQVAGPFTLVELQALIDRKKILGETKVCKEGQDWFAGDRFPELDFPKAEIAPEVKPMPPQVPGQSLNLMNCPSCAKEISIKALECPHCGHKLKSEQTAVGIVAAIIIGGILAFMLFAMLR